MKALGNPRITQTCEFNFSVLGEKLDAAAFVAKSFRWVANRTCFDGSKKHRSPTADRACKIDPCPVFSARDHTTTVELKGRSAGLDAGPFPSEANTPRSSNCWYCRRHIPACGHKERLEWLAPLVVNERVVPRLRYRAARSLAGVRRALLQKSTLTRGRDLEATMTPPLLLLLLRLLRSLGEPGLLRARAGCSPRRPTETLRTCWRRSLEPSSSTSMQRENLLFSFFALCFAHFETLADALLVLACAPGSAFVWAMSACAKRTIARALLRLC